MKTHCLIFDIDDDIYIYIKKKLYRNAKGKNGIITHQYDYIGLSLNESWTYSVSKEI